MSQRTFSGTSSQSHFAPSVAPASSSQVTITISSPLSGRQPERPSSHAAATSHATCPFMSSAPLPHTNPSRTSPDHGSTLHSDASASTVSTWPSRHRRGPSDRAGKRAIKFGRSLTAPINSHSKPDCSSSARSISCATRSLPGGLTVSCWISFCSSVVASCASAMNLPGHHRAWPSTFAGRPSLVVITSMSVDLTLAPKQKRAPGEPCCEPLVHPSVSFAEAERLAGVAKALADPIRVQLVDVLRRHAGKVCVCELTPLFDVSQSTVSHHLKVLRDAGLVGVERRGLWAYYYVTPAAGKELGKWLR